MAAACTTATLRRCCYFFFFSSLQHYSVMPSPANNLATKAKKSPSSQLDLEAKINDYYFIDYTGSGSS